MTFQSNKTTYVPVMKVLRGEANDILICRDALSEREDYYTLLAIHDHEIVKKLLCVMERSSRGKECCEEVFWQGDVFCAVFPHVKERYLKSFYMPAQITLETCGKICENLILACMLSKLPYPLLYLALAQGQIHLRKDYAIEPGYTIELDELTEKIGERECAGQCAGVLRELLEPVKGRENMAYRFFMRKWEYEDFGVLYRDMRLIRRIMKKEGRFTGLWLFFKSRQDTMCKLLRAACMAMIFLALLCLLSRAVWGEIPFLRIFVNHFTMIGTQSLAG